MTLKSHEVHDFSNTQFLIVRISTSIIKNGIYFRFYTEITDFEPNKIEIHGVFFEIKAAIKYYGLDTDGESGHYSCIVPINNVYYEISDDQISIYDFDDFVKLKDILILFLKKKD
jgi:hypothetical protein